MEHLHPDGEHDHRCRECDYILLGRLPVDLECTQCGSDDVEPYRGVIECSACEHTRETDRIPPSFLPRDVYCAECDDITSHSFVDFASELEAAP